MDTSQEYIKKCKKAVEIQFIRPYDEGDFFMRKVDWDSAIDKDELKVLGSYKSEYASDDYGIWLPRQDQLQEITSDIYGWCVFDQRCDEVRRGKGRLSKEICGLMAVMEDKYNKTWNGEDWV